ncbi:RHS repeat-associated core domain-containing protein [Chryseobacterium viscerum]|uniref:RHS repeat-associated core domain-containing protein n=1 Tax=Chryseobacterium viscerum TaxID=1037377 RepID=UPI002221FBCF|nr:RHS repeat-associated core domain-containing protein [Chryseobacterium viscerum]MCW1961287.1 RHS repeat-associated core domain-containing protein [Chryseobacterium viscerum]
MKRILNIFSILFVAGSSYAQTSPSTTENYIQTRTYLEKVTTSSPGARQAQTVQYFDGLGRAVQTIDVKATPAGKDIVTPVIYDEFGRQTKSYLPVPQPGTQGGAIYSAPLNNATAIYGNERIYGEKVLENAPASKIKQVTPIGNEWALHPSTFTYAANTTGEVIWFSAPTSGSVIYKGKYPAGTLYKKTATDADGNLTIEFSNGLGQVILARNNDDTKNIDTYYVYNEYGQLAYVIPPLAVKDAAPDQTALDNLCYQYQYDGQGRMIEKKLPGKGREYMVYDRQDRLVAKQDTELKKKGQWLYTKYDQFGRVAFTGIFSGAARSSEQTLADGFGSNNTKRTTGAFFNREGMDVFYDPNGTYPDTGWVKLLSVNYYDTYPQYSFNPAFPAAILGKPVISDVQNTSINTKNLPVVSLVKNIEDDNWTKNYVYYDDRGRTIGTYSVNHLGGYTKTESELDFAGVTKQSKVYHKRLPSDPEKVITQTFEYDSQNRLKKQWHQVNSQPQELLSENSYNELSQLSNKKVGNNLQSIDYAYDIRGAVIKMNNPAVLNGKLFGYELKYTNPLGTSSKYNGTIGEVDWKTVTDNVLRRYTYEYDGLNRLKKALYSEPGASVPQNGFYNETIGYDMNSNITSIKRNTGLSGIASLMDDLTYNYTGNRLNAVTDASSNYSGYPDVSGSIISYDDNGNMTNHLDKGILQIDYNLLNLPDYVKFDTSYRSHDTSVLYNVNTRYTYRADGTKIRKVYTYGSGRGQFEAANIVDYLDGFQYEGDDIVGSALPVPALKFVPTAEGYYDFENNRYIYSYTDHLGNVRLSYFKNAGGSAEALEENNYYPFGLKHLGYNNVGGNPSYNYQYNGKELQKETGWNDYGARMYMADIGRWGVIDPLAETSRRFSPYTYALNNPVSFIDPDGRKAAMPYEASDMAPQHPNSGWWMGIAGDGYRMPATGMGRGGGPFAGNLPTFGETQAYRDLMASIKNGGDFSLKTKNGYMSWWTGGALGDATTAQEMVGHMMKFEDKTLSDSYFDGFVGGAQSSWNYIKGQFFGESYWNGLANTFTLGAYGTVKTLNSLIDITSNIPNYTSNDYSYGAGYLTEKAAEAIILREAAEVNPFGFRGGYGFKIGKVEFLYSNPSVGGGTIFSYVSSTNNKFRLDYHGLPSLNKGNTLHFHTNYWGYTNSPHRSLNPFRWGQPIK